ncbi:apolipoprotein N-acyltransferase [Kamptonema cortianum]|nr:apolipoprotein N-acyltransferase [Geitlerinema splendidum]MDK3157689.1 apolipoprotein N-acyltransferase [Kamptonema cortianum]
MKAQLLRAWPIVASVVLLAAAFPPINLFLLPFVALIPWLVSLRETDRRGAAKSGYLFGFLYFLFQMYWLIPFVGKWTGNVVLAAIPWILAASIAGLFYMLVAWLIKICFEMERAWLIPLVWAGIEGFRAYVPGLAFPWGISALPLWRLPDFVQHAAFGTIFLVSAWVILANLILLEIFYPTGGQKSDRHFVWRATIVFLSLMFMGTSRVVQAPPAKTLTVTLAQPGVNMAFTPADEERRLLDEAAETLTATAIAQRSDLIVFPEGFAGGHSQLPPDTILGEEPVLPVMMGGHWYEGEKTFQSAYLWDGQTWAHADKTRLVIFGEYVPFRNVFPFLKSFNLASGDLSASSELKSPLIAGVRTGPLICFEGVFPDLAAKHSHQGAQVLVQMSIDDWYEGTPAWDQLWMSSVWRSIESGLPMVRVGARGRTFSTDFRGKMQVAAPVGEEIPVKANLKVPAAADGFAWRMAFVWLTWLVCIGVGIGGLKSKFDLRGRDRQTSAD